MGRGVSRRPWHRRFLPVFLAVGLLSFVFGTRTVASAADGGAPKVVPAPPNSARLAVAPAPVAPKPAAKPADDDDKEEKDAAKPAKPKPERKPGDPPERVTVGLYMHHIPELDLK